MERASFQTSSGESKAQHPAPALPQNVEEETQGPPCGLDFGKRSGPPPKVRGRPSPPRSEGDGRGVEYNMSVRDRVRPVNSSVPASAQGLRERIKLGRDRITRPERNGTA